MRYKRAKRKFVRKRVWDFTISDSKNCSITMSRDKCSYKYYWKTTLFDQLYAKSSYGFVWLFWHYHDVAYRKGLRFYYSKKEID